MWIDAQILRNADQALRIEVFRPESAYVVLGRSNKAEEECQISSCERAGIPILKRLGGGGTVVLYPGCVIVSIGCWVRDRFENAHYFRTINDAVINAISSTFATAHHTMRQDGISDLCIGDRKFGGTSLFRSRNYLLYQASIIYELDLPLIDRLLRHPTREPEYRRGRDHRNFLIGLKGTTDQIMPIEQFTSTLSGLMPRAVEHALSDRIIPPAPEQIDYILGKATN